jgi:hypothetical protein
MLERYHRESIASASGGLPQHRGRLNRAIKESLRDLGAQLSLLNHSVGARLGCAPWALAVAAAVTWCNCHERFTVKFSLSCWGLGWPSTGVSARAPEVPMTATIPWAALVPVTHVFTNTERLALAGFLAGYSGLTRQANELDLRQYAAWCQQMLAGPARTDPRSTPGSASTPASAPA